MLMKKALLTISILLFGCVPDARLQPVTIVVASWYGFYPFYYAIEQGLDEQHGIRMKILEPTNIANLRRSYLRDQVDLAATSMLEFTNAVSLSEMRMKPLLITDYSTGGDVIIAKKSIKSIDELRGKRIAAPSKGIAEYILSLIFDEQENTKPYTQIKLPETQCAQAFINDEIDACVTYAPISTYLLENNDLHVVYTSKQHEMRIFDLIWAKTGTDAAVLEKVSTVWFDIIKHIKQNPREYHEFVARIASVDIGSVEETMRGIHLISKYEHDELLLNTAKLAEDIMSACQIANGNNCAQFQYAFSWQ